VLRRQLLTSLKTLLKGVSKKYDTDAAFLASLQALGLPQPVLALPLPDDVDVSCWVVVWMT
jgi:hypothetical protein